MEQLGGATMSELQLAERLGLAVALAFFLGLAFEEVYKQQDRTSPGGVRTFPMLALAGAMLHRIEPNDALAFVAGLVALSVWLHAFLRRDPDGAAEGGVDRTLMIPASNLVAYVIGPVALTEPAWVAVALTVAAVLLLGHREPLHGLVRSVPRAEILTAGKFLILVGIILPLAPDRPVVEAIPVTPYRVWLAVVAVSGLSYASYLVQRYVPTREGVLVPAVLGGFYSSTATTVALARRQREAGAARADIAAGTLAATAIMHLRLLLVVLLFDRALAAAAAPALLLLFAAGATLAWREWRKVRGDAAAANAPLATANPLQVMSAAIFAALFVAVSVASSWVGSNFGRVGLFTLAALVGATDIDPFVLSLAQGGAPGMPAGSLAAALLIAASANNLAKAVYAAIFGTWRAMAGVALQLAALAGLGLLATIPYLL
jgi:uncharacterized membrane protein (DUF4010 family)